MDPAQGELDLTAGIREQPGSDSDIDGFANSITSSAQAGNVGGIGAINRAGRLSPASQRSSDKDPNNSTKTLAEHLLPGNGPHQSIALRAH